MHFAAVIGLTSCSRQPSYNTAYAVGSVVREFGSRAQFVERGESLFGIETMKAQEARYGIMVNVGEILYTIEIKRSSDNPRTPFSLPAAIEEGTTVKFRTRGEDGGCIFSKDRFGILTTDDIEIYRLK